MSVDVELDYNTVIAGNSEINSEIDIEMSTNQEIEVYIEPREYKVVGDDVYIPINFDSAPTWLTQAITDLTNIKVTDVVTNLNSMINDLTYAVQQIEVAKNQYEQSIVALNNIDSRFNSVLTTLNSNMDGLDASLKDLIATKVTSTQASVVALNAITTAMNDTSTGSTLGSAILNLQTSITNLNNSTNASLTSLESSINGAVNANAQAVEVINTYVGIDDAGASNGTGLLADVEILQKQNDGVIETTTGTYDVMISPENPDLAQLVITAEPYVTWKAADVSGIDTRLAHIGDVYVKYADTSNGAKEYVASYKFIRTVVDSTSPYATDSDGFTWALIIDQASQDAYTQALNAYDLADNKRRVFTITPSGSIDEGDLWVTGTNPQVVKVYKSGNWELSDTQVNNFISVTYTPTVTSLQNQIDGKVESWYTLSTNNPKTTWTDAATRSKHDGDLWYQTDTKLSYYYSSSTNSWNLIDDAKAIQALADAATAQATADGKISSYYISTLALAQSMSSAWTATEKTNNIGDLVVVWDDSTLDNNGTWRWNGTSWVTTRDKKLVALASAVTALSTELDNGTNTWASADSTLENSLMTEISDEGARVESKFAYNSVVSINGVPYNSGFGLATSLEGEEFGIPVGTSEFWINAEKFKFTNTNKTGSVAPFTIDTSESQPQITFNGKVTFGSGQTGTIDQAIAAVVETVAVSDKNINITDNLIPTASLVADTDNSGYQFIGTPTKSMSAGLESFSEAQIILDGSDEAYSPYVDEVTIPYYYRFGIKGITNLDRFKVVTINASNVVTYNNVTVTMEVGKTLSTGNWYTVDGIINPLGGTTTADGDIRDINGVKVGSINNFVIPVGTTKVLLGWIADCTISRMKMCKITADTITSDFSSVNGQLTNLQSQIDNVDVSWNSLSGKDIFAQKLGYATYSALEAAAISGQTIVNGGYINTGLIQVGAIAAGQINTTGLVADDISSTIISGKTINGSVINGARINGAVIKASYLDLNGELEVLTNFIISTAMYNANPSLYSDSVFISSDNTYRIPTSSVIYEQAISSSIVDNGGALYGIIRSYNCANAGHNSKAVKIRPTISVSSPVTIMDMRQSASYNCNGSFYLGDILLINLRIISIGNTLVYSVTTIDDGTINYTIDDSNANAGAYVFSQTRTVVSSGVSFTISVGAANNQYGYSASAIIKLNQGNHTLTRDFNYTGNGFKLMRLYNNGGYDSCTTALGTDIYINNLL